MHRPYSLSWLLALSIGLCGLASVGDALAGSPQKAQANKVVMFVWDGLRPDAITAADTPHLHRLKKEGVEFADHHSTYPTFTLMNGATLATGAFPGTTGFYGNTLWQPGPTGKNQTGAPVDFNQPVFTEDYAILRALDAFYGNRLLLVETLFQAAQKAGFTTAAIGKSGPAFLQDRGQGGLILLETMAYPQSFVHELQAAGFKIPKHTALAYPPGTPIASSDDPTAFMRPAKLVDGATSDPTDHGGSPFASANRYLMETYLDHVLPRRNPDLSVIWLRDPDATAHIYGPGTENYRDALRRQDELLGRFRDRLKALGLADRTNIIVVSDHGHSTISGPSEMFPLRAIVNHEVGPPSPGGYAASGNVRLTDLLARAGFKAFDGAGCVHDPVLSGLKADNAHVYPDRTDDDGSVCGMAGKVHTTASFKVPARVPPGALVVAANGGSEYVYVPDHDRDLVRRVVRFLQSREEFGAIFVSAVYGAIPGTLSMEVIRLQNTQARNPDIVVSYDFDESAAVRGVRGTVFQSMVNQGYRGMHGTFSPADVHNTLIAYGPDFRRRLVSRLPSANVDVAPTIASLLGIDLPGADGRPLLEALRSGPLPKAYKVTVRTIKPEAPATQLSMKLPTDPDGHDVDAGKTNYTIELKTKSVESKGKTYTYFDYAKAIRY
jgi:arylsulfatase A-like enzyme